MSAATEPGRRIATLDIVRGVAVMGILAMNIVAFAMPFQAYMNPLAYGTESAADLASWALSYVFIDGKMRGLFSLLFGAGMLLVIERAEASGGSAASVHYRRMLWLLAFGLLHYYFIWFGDILALYAQVGLVAFLFRRLSVRALMRWGAGLIVVQLLVFVAMAAGTLALQSEMAQASPPPEAVAQWQDIERQLGVPDAAALAEKIALFTGPWRTLVEHRLDHVLEPFTSTLFLGWETLGYFLLGMAALKSGFLRGEWPAEDYRSVMLIGFGIGIPASALLAALAYAGGFTIPVVMATVLAAPVLFRVPMVIAAAALIILLTRRGGPLVDRIAAAGRAAFTNYLGSSILMTGLFYGWGFGLYGSLSRVELWIVVVAMWALMLAWSKPWLDRYRYGPLEWLWRTLARWQVQTLRKPPPPA